MAWIKRNLFFVISVAVGLLLTGYCGYLLYTAIADNSDVTSKFSDAVSSLQQMQQKNPYPSRENVQVAMADQKHIRTFLGEFRTKFAPFPPPPREDDKGFRTYLADSLVRFRAGATNAGVELPPDYGFSFASLMGHLNYPPAAIAAWMQELQEISAILNILYEAKINYLSTLCRVPVSADDAGAGDCLLQATPVTNVWGIVTPYKITFRGFSAELAAVMEGFARSSNCFIIKSIDVTQDKSVPLPQTQPQQMVQPMAPTYVQPPIMNRPGLPGLGGRGQLYPGYAPRRLTPVPSQAATPAVSGAPVTILTEEPLLITISVDVVKLKASDHP